MKVIILHGWGHNGNLWQRLAKQLGNSTMAIDMPGFGLEPLVDDSWNIPDYANWVEEQISNYKELVLVGHSFGGRVAAEIASRKPKYLKAIVLSGAPCLYRPTKATKLRIKVYKFLKAFLPQSARKLFYSGDLKNAGQLEKIFRKVVAYDQTKQLKKINIPTLLIWGINDNQVPLKTAYEMRKIIPNSELKIIEDAGHNAFLDKPDLFYGYVKNYISNL